MYKFDSVSPKRRVNPWAIPLWLAEHPFIGGFIVSVALCVVFFALHFLWEPLILPAFFFGGIAALTVVGTVGIGVLIFFFDEGHEDVARWIRERYERSERIED